MLNQKLIAELREYCAQRQMYLDMLDTVRTMPNNKMVEKAVRYTLNDIVGEMSDIVEDMFSEYIGYYRGISNDEMDNIDIKLKERIDKEKVFVRYISSYDDFATVIGWDIPESFFQHLIECGFCININKEEYTVDIWTE